MVRQKNTALYKKRSQIKRRRAKNGGASAELLIRKTGRHVYADVIDLNSGKTLTIVSSIKISKENKEKSNMEIASLVGQGVAKYCNEFKINPAINIADNRFHGIIKSLVDSFVVGLKS